MAGRALSLLFSAVFGIAVLVQPSEECTNTKLQAALPEAEGFCTSEMQSYWFASS